LPWLYSLRRLLPAFEQPCVDSPMARALSMLWFGCGVFLTTLAIAAIWGGDIRQGWFDAVVAGVLGIAFFVSAWLSNLGWLRLVAVFWWLGAAASSRGAAAIGCADAPIARRTGLVAVVSTQPRMTDFDHAAIDELLHSRVRLAIVAFLAGVETADFSAVRQAIKTTDGNASVHLRKLEDAGYIAARKRFVARKPQTLYVLTENGRRALLDYVAHLERLLPPGDVSSGQSTDGRQR
jgi:DNA-binding transcriptional ArsR family regulator